MSLEPVDRVTEILETGLARGASAQDLMPLVYDELRRLAGGYLRRENAGHTLQATALVHEAYEKLVDQTRVDWQGRAHFLAVAAQAMRRVLIDHARRRGRDKRGGGQQRITLEASRVGRAEGLVDAGLGQEVDLDELLSLDRMLTELAEHDPRAARVVELRYFAGLTVPEVAQVLEVSVSTVEGDWRHARAWLKKALASDHGHGTA